MVALPSGLPQQIFCLIGTPYFFRFTYVKKHWATIKK